MPTIKAGEVELYYETLGDGLALLLMVGARLDSGVFEAVADAETFLSVGDGDLEPPTDEELAAVSVPVRALVSEQSPPFFEESATWLAGGLGVEVSRMGAGPRNRERAGVEAGSWRR